MTSIAFILWPLVGLLFFRVLKVPAAIAATIIGGYLLLPERGGFDLPLLPAIDKAFVPTVAALVFAIAFRNRAVGALPGWLPRSPVILLLITLLIVGAFGTAFTNSDTIRIADRVLPGMRPYDALSIAMNAIVGLIPFLLARKFLATPESHWTLLLVLVVAGFGYSFLALYEIRMSPQLSTIIYGFFPHSWVQHFRSGGYRPVVFLNHALWLAIFLACCTLAAFALWRIGDSKWRLAFLGAGLWLAITLVLAKSFGAVVITFTLAPLVLLLPFRIQILAAAILATILTVYPVLRAGGLVPTEAIVETLSKINPDRVGNLEFRLMHEDTLLNKANERPVFGWGGYGRGRIYDENGRDVSVTDGMWILVFASGGWISYVANFGLLTFAIFSRAVRWRRYELEPSTAALSVVLAANLIDLIPNATSTSVTLLMAGALAGRLEILTRRRREERVEPLPATRETVLGATPNSAATSSRTDVHEVAPVATNRQSLGFSRFAPRPGRNS